MNIGEVISTTTPKLLERHGEYTVDGRPLVFPNTDRIVGILQKIRAVVFPWFFNESTRLTTLDERLRTLLAAIHEDLAMEIRTASRAASPGHMANVDDAMFASLVSMELLEGLSDIQQLLYKDARAGYDGDPAARSENEVILTYPGFFAVFVYRIAHFLFLKGVSHIPRMMSEYAHNVTGIDIHPGAEIGEYFFIDHGTGVVIGETTVIGNHVKLYQGVTLGALSTKSGQKLAGKKRHPTIEDNVIIYSGASILGGDTVIGKNAVIGGNAFIVKSVPANTVVKILNPELQYNDGSGAGSREFTQSDTWFYEI